MEADRTIADGGWHRVECRRSGGDLSISVDAAMVSSSIPQGMDLTTTEPVRIGGKSVKDGNDPFHGELSDVTLSITP